MINAEKYELIELSFRLYPIFSSSWLCHAPFHSFHVSWTPNYGQWVIDRRQLDMEVAAGAKSATFYYKPYSLYKYLFLVYYTL